MLRAVLDTNVLLSAFIRPGGPPGQILQLLLQHQAFELVLSDHILDELRRTLSYPKVRRCMRISADEVEQSLIALALMATVVEGELKVSVVQDDPDDDMFIAAALESGADVVVSGDDHLLKVKEYEGVRVLTPRVFLEMLRATPFRFK